MKRKALLQSAAPMLLLLAWQLMSRLRLWPPGFFPSPAEAALTIGRMVGSGALPAAALLTLWRVVVSFAVAAAGGVLLGATLARFDRLSALISPIVGALQVVPPICWFPLAALWFGFTPGAGLFVAVVGALLTITAAAERAIRGTPLRYIRSAATMGARGLVLYTRVIFPAALPPLLSGLRDGWRNCWRSLMAAELLLPDEGLGRLLNAGRPDATQIVAVLLAILAVGLAVDRLLFGLTERAVRRRWGVERFPPHQEFG
jgi:NitT/TauT family transport system permease protein